MLRIKHDYLGFILYLSVIDRHYLLIEKYIGLTGNLNHFYERKDNLVKPILFTMR